MLKETVIYLTPQQAEQTGKYKEFLAQHLNISPQKIKHFEIIKKSLDARKKPPRYHLMMNVFIDSLPPAKEVEKQEYQHCTNKRAVYIIGSGPAGLFAALELIKGGVKPIIIERGKTIDKRKADIAKLSVNHILNIDSNYCYGEGGAGTFSDGKLYTRSKKKGDINEVLKTFVLHGAPENILYDATPHIGTDVLPSIIQSMRQTIVTYGGEFMFNSKLTDIEIAHGRIKSITINNSEQYAVDVLILATGHSARDVFCLLQQRNVFLEAKPFALGVRVEHPQELINSIQYGGGNYDKKLPAAAYKLVTQVGNRGVFSFCMCPGGIIVPSATENGQVVVNGMSNAKRNSPYANSGIVVQVFPDDIVSANPLKLMYFQEEIEQRCCISHEAPQKAPAQRMEDFINGTLSRNLPKNSYHPGTQSMMLDEILPSFIAKSLKEAFRHFDNKMRGFFTNEAVLLATESRTSSPVRICRDKNTFAHVQIKNLYPCGEGAGYAGGITSSAIDGINAAKAVISI